MLIITLANAATFAVQPFLPKLAIPQITHRFPILQYKGPPESP